MSESTAAKINEVRVIVDAIAGLAVLTGGVPEDLDILYVDVQINRACYLLDEVRSEIVRRFETRSEGGAE